MSFVSKKTRIARLLKSKPSRDAYVLENLKRMVPFQIRTMREERDWSQAQAGEAIGKPQNVVSRLESPAYGKLTLQTLLDIAKGFDVGLLIRFVPFSRLVQEYEDLSPQALSAKSVTDKEEVAKLQAWASSGQNIDLGASLKRQFPAQLRALDEPVSTSAIQHTLVFSSPALVTQADNSTSNQSMTQPTARAAAA